VLDVRLARSSLHTDKASVAMACGELDNAQNQALLRSAFSLSRGFPQSIPQLAGFLETPASIRANRDKLQQR